MSNDIPTISGPGFPMDRGSSPLPTIKGYKIIRQLGEGGMGIVYLAEQTEPIKRQVALKIVKPGMDSREIIARFEAEKQTLAQLDHPNIAHVYDAGTTEKERPYFVMEYINGVPITDYCDQQRLSIEERLKLFKQVCEGIQHAHQRGIIHRDIKPSNILILTEQDKAIPKVIDFGVAKAISQKLTEQTMFTAQGQLLGTPEYMSPEQADLTGYNIDIRTDVYSLGVVLYQLLTGALPFEPETLRKAAFAEIQRIIKEDDPPKPSTKLSSMGDEAIKIAETRKTVLGALTKRLHKELEWIPLKAMRKESDLRYQSASEFAGDIDNYLNGDPLLAGPESKAYRIKKYVRRNRVFVISAVVIVLILILGIIVSTFFAVKAEKARVISEQNREAAEKAKEEETKQKQVAEQEKIKANEAEKETKKQADIANQEKIKAEEKSLGLQQEMYANKIADAQKTFELLEPNSAVKILLSCPEDLRHWEWYYLWHVSTTAGFWNYERIRSDTGPNFGTAFETNLGIYQHPSFLGGALKKIEDHNLIGTTVEFSSDSKYLFSETSSMDFSGKVESEIKIWDIESGKEINQIKVPDSTIRNFCVDPNGGRLAISTNKEVIIADLNGTILKRQNAHGKGFYPDSEQIAWSPDGKYIAFESRIEYDMAGVIEIWNIEKDEIIHTITLKNKDEGMQRNSLSGSEHDIYSLVFSPDSKSLVAGTNFSWSSNRTLRVWDVKTGKEQMLFDCRNSIITTLSFSPDGKYLAELRMNKNWDGDKTIKIWDFEKGIVKQVLEGHSDAVTSISYSPDGKRIATASDDRTIRIWAPNTGTECFRITLHTIMSYKVQVKFSPDGKRLAMWGPSAGQGGKINILTASSKEDVEKWKQVKINESQAIKQAKLSEEEDFLNAVKTGDKTKLNDYFGQEKYWERFSSFPLIQAISMRADANTFDLLIERGADVNADDALYKAVEENYLEAVKVLVENGAEIEAEGTNHYTPLQLAAKNGKKEIIEYLIDHGADINAINDSQDTPLVLALENGHLDIAKLLINKGANVNLEDVSNPLDYAQKNGHAEIVKIIQEHGGATRDEIRKFYAAIKYEKAEQVQHILEEHPNFIKSIKDGKTPIVVAIREGDIEKINLLIEKGSPINITDEDGMTPIHYAASSGRKDILEVLIKNGANVNHIESLRGDAGYTPLHCAASKGHKEIIEVLLNNGADINFQGEYPSDTPLHLAVKSDNNDIVQYLLSKGADINRSNAMGETPINYAKTDEMKEFLKSKGGLKISDLLNAIKEENFEKIKEILKRAPCLANSETGNPYGNSVFNKAIEKNNIEIVRLFIHAGTDVNYRIKRGEYPLKVALESGINTEIPKLLMENGANVNCAEWYSHETPLHKAIAKKDFELVKIMIEKGAGINRECIGLGSPLNMAIEYTPNEIIQLLLLRNGADISGDKGIGYLEKTVERGNTQAVRFLLENGVSVNGDKGKAIFQKAFQNSFRENDKILEYLITYGADFKGIKNDFGQSVLHYALRIMRNVKNVGDGIIFDIDSVETTSPDINFVKLLIAKKADINVKDEQGNSPLRDAIWSKDIELMKMLIENGADVNTQDKNGNTLFHVADIRGYYVDIPGKTEKILGLLYDKGADINKPNNDGLTPLQFAVFYCPDIVQIIKAKGGTSQSALIDAIIQEDIEKVKSQILLDPNEINLLDKAGNSLLHYATALQNYEIAKYLIDAGINVDIKNKIGFTALNLAVDRNNIPILELLLINGANVNTQDNEARISPLQRALYIKDENKRAEVVRLLLKYKVDMNLKYEANVYTKYGRGNTVLHEAVCSSEELAKLILATNPDLTLKNADGLNPLELALKIKKLNIVKLIKQYGGNASDPALNAVLNNDINSIEVYLKKDPQLVYNSSLPNISLIYLMAYFGDIKTIDLISKYGILTDSLIYDLASMGKNEMIEELLKRGVGVNCLSGDGDTPLIYAALFGQKETVLFLINNGADINIKDKQNGTCLHAACRNGHDEIVRILVERGNDINAKGQNNITPLHLAANEGHEKVVKTLLENGADLNAKNNENKTPLDLAKKQGHKEVVKLLSTSTYVK